MKRALVACVGLALSAAPVGIFLILRRLSLMGDALSHSVLPGAAIGYVVAGLSLVSMGIGGLISGLMVAVLAGLTSRFTHLKEDATFAGFFLISMALGVFIISTQHNTIDLVHVLFGSALAVDAPALILIGSITTLTLIILALIYRPLIIDCFNPMFLRKGIPHMLLLTLVVLNLVSGFQALGTLLALGIMMLPALSARFWSQRIERMLVISTLFALFSGYLGLLIAYHGNLPTGPSIVLTSGFFYIISLLVGPYGSVRKHVSQFDYLKLMYRYVLPKRNKSI